MNARRSLVVNDCYSFNCKLPSKKTLTGVNMLSFLAYFTSIVVSTKHRSNPSPFQSNPSYLFFKTCNLKISPFVCFFSCWSKLVVAFHLFQSSSEWWLIDQASGTALFLVLLSLPDRFESLIHLIGFEACGWRCSLFLSSCFVSTWIN